MIRLPLRRSHIYSAGVVTTALLCLSGCESTKEKLKGKREPLVLIGQDLSIDKTLQTTPIKISKPLLTTVWPQAGYNGKNESPHAELGAPTALKSLWKTSIGQGAGSRQQLLTNLISENNLVITMDAYGRVSAHSLNDGKKQWVKETSPEKKQSDTLGGGLVANNDYVFVATSFGEILALHLKTGEVAWKTTISNPCRSSPSLDGNRLYVLTVANEVVAIDCKNGEQMWVYAGLPEAARLLGGGKVAVGPDVVIAALGSGEIVGLNPLNGSVMWTDALSSSVGFASESNISDVRARPLIVGDTVYIISHGGRMAAFQIYTGERLFQKEIGGMRSPCTIDGSLFFINNHNELVAMDMKTGHIRWVSPLNTEDHKSLQWIGPLCVNSHLLVMNHEGKGVFFTLSDGKKIHDLQLGSRSVGISPIVVNKTLFVLSNNGELHAWRK